MEKQDVSAIICTYNPDVTKFKKVVADALKRFKEVIIIDDCSDIYLGKFKKCVFFQNKKQMGLKDSRARGAALASYDTIVFLSDDFSYERE